MKTLYKFALMLLLVPAALVAQRLGRANAQSGTALPTPTYDPFVEPPLPPNPTEYELGRNLYWHWCMTCHGDRGQGLTDEFRGMWEPDHQNCWAHGCHAGKEWDMGFPIPTLMPSVVNEDQLKQFASLQELVDFLKATHPPQSPGTLKDEEYQVIAVFVFTLNGRLPLAILVTETPTLPALQPSPQKSANILFPVYVIIAFTAVLLGAFVLARRTRVHDG